METVTNEVMLLISLMLFSPKRAGSLKKIKYISEYVLNT